jgi:hypothetical protein
MMSLSCRSFGLLFHFTCFVAVGACLLGLDGCAGSPDTQISNGGSAGAMAGVGGKSSLAGGGGAPASAGMAGMSGAAGSGAPALVVDCGGLNYADVLANDCATPGCHRGAPTQAPSRLVLTPDAGLVGRLKDVPAKHLDIFCIDQNMFCTPAVCDMTALLVNSASPEQSWLITKLRGTQNGCGDRMPSEEYDPAKQQCLENVARAIAALPK